MFSYTLLEYDAEGNETKRCYTADGSLSEVFESDSDGNVVRWEGHNKDGTLESYWLYQYDNVGGPTRAEHYDSSGILLMAGEYDKDGHVVKEEYYDGGRNMIFYFVNEYDAQGELTRINGHDGDGTLTSYGIPDDAGNVVWYNLDGTPQ